ncbi:hypothetical protein [Aliamphritea ceti]|uniref:hypothetical protein n=1 Tax=Aliamphritea ceti TaxID=1524258 RepID=UPI0021C33161|nr:hypothetical protein [Aliamphritea ceti]
MSMQDDDQSFFDVSLSDIGSIYLQVEQAKAESKVKQIEAQSANQQQALHAPSVDSMQDAINMQNAQYSSVEGYWDRIPKPLLYGSAALLFGAVLIKAVKSV